MVKKWGLTWHPVNLKMLTNMNINSNYITRIQEDWPHGHQLMIKLFLKYANFAVREITVMAKTRNPIFETPNRPFLSGMIRFGAVDYFLDRACKMNLLPGISPQWIPLTKGEGVVHALELQGKHTSLVAHHISTPNDPPRGSILRNYRRLLNHRCLLNEQNPALSPEFEDSKNETTPANNLVNLTLVHGGKPSEFAYLRIYHRRDKPKKFIPFSNDNIMLLEPESSRRGGVEQEQIADAEVELKKHLEEIKKQQAQE
jgi:hypothetical protein